VDVWGQLRFEPNGFVGGTAQIQFRPQGESDFQNLGSPIQVADALGYFDVQVPSPGRGTWRITSTATSGFELFSRSVPVQ
jgi:hypothetical protein